MSPRLATVLRSIVLVLVVLVAAACSSRSKDGPAASSDKPRVAVSIFPLWDIARRVAGDGLDVVLVLPPGRSEHSYDPTPKEMAQVAKSKLGISVGLGMDGWLEKIVRGAAGTDVPIVQLGPKANPRRMTAEEVGADAAEEGEDHDAKGHDDHHDDKAKHEHEHEKHEDGREHDDGDHAPKPEPKGAAKGEHDHHGHHHAHGAEDPHFWLDPVRMKSVVPELVEAFAKLDPKGAEGYRARGKAVEAELDKLHADLEARAKGWTKKTIVTFHGSMGYFAERYGLSIAAVIEPFPGKEPTARYVKDVLAAVEKTKPAALFSEPQLDRRPAQVIADQGKLPLFELDPIGGSAGAETYEKLFLKNADVLDKALK
ncbi:metal ABC transporter substrate-binding protein [Polyangium sorediatum]|uniref:Metal ABC transporter substrate-binding protein n=1 Tax=Polyangium sorediatum TaxID=889274 RepID=A0ABT6NUQ4_9BACT|nr:metal ABC transporter substrate-binding protein [Polyangium sorediatum]MDI1432052.1 metal ABC transporter substrate-binding protein [Polyangium sorediatum]